MGREEIKRRQLAYHQLMSQPRHHFSPHSTAKSMIKSQISGLMVSNGIKAQISGLMVSSGISDVVISSVYLRKPV